MNDIENAHGSSRDPIWEMPIFGKPIGDYTMGELKQAAEKHMRKIRAKRAETINKIKELQKEIRWGLAYVTDAVIERFQHFADLAFDGHRHCGNRGARPVRRR
jgi:hypothetical protein